MAKVTFKNLFQKHPLFFSLPLKNNHDLSSAPVKNPGVILDSSLFLLQPSTQQILKSLLQNLSRIQLLLTTSLLPPYLPSQYHFSPGKRQQHLTALPHHILAPSSFFSHEQPECAFKNMSDKTLQELAFSLNKRPVLSTVHKPHITRIPTATSQTASPLAPFSPSLEPLLLLSTLLGMVLHLHHSMALALSLSLLSFWSLFTSHLMRIASLISFIK